MKAGQTQIDRPFLLLGYTQARSLSRCPIVFLGGNSLGADKGGSRRTRILCMRIVVLTLACEGVASGVSQHSSFILKISQPI